MPIITQKQVEYVLANVTADMDALRVVANLRWLVDGQDCGLIRVEAQGEEFAALLAAMPEAGKSRADDIADLIYQFALAKGIVQGSVA